MSVHAPWTRPQRWRPRISKSASHAVCPSPRDGESGPPADTTFRKTGGDAAIENNVFAQPHLGTQTHGILSAECSPVRGNREFLVGRQSTAAECDRDRGSLEGLPHLSLQGRDTTLEHGDIVLETGDALRTEARRRKISESIRGYE